MTNRKLK